MKLMKLSGLLLIVGAVMSFIEPYTIGFSRKNDRLKCIVVSGDTTTRYIYDAQGNISETESWFGYQKFDYDNNGRLVMLKHAADPQAHLATRSPNQKNMMMTARNSRITDSTRFEYDNQGRLSQSKYYSNNFKQNYEFVHKGITTFMYDRAGRLLRTNPADKNGIKTQFSTYEYDTRGNMVREGNYSLPTRSVPPELISETIYKFDNKNNPYHSFRIYNLAGIDTNPNNIVERKYIYYEPTGKNTVTTNKSSFTYNANGFPIEEKSNNVVFIFVYE